MPILLVLPNSSTQPCVSKEATDALSANLTRVASCSFGDCTPLLRMIVDARDVGDVMMIGVRNFGSSFIPFRLRKLKAPVSVRLTLAPRPVSDTAMTTAGMSYCLVSLSLTST